MKVKVLKAFIDKNTKLLNEVGSVIDVTKERFEELRTAGNYVAVEKVAKAPKEVKVEATEPTTEDEE